MQPTEFSQISLYVFQSDLMKCNHITFILREMGSFLILLIMFLLIGRLNANTYVNSQCEFSFADQTYLFAFCRTIAHTSLNFNQTTYYQWGECIEVCCPVGTAQTVQQTMDYLTDKCGKTQEDSLLAVILGFSIGLPLFIAILICVYCKPWKHCITADPLQGLQETRGQMAIEKIRSVVLESNGYSFDGERKSADIINFQQNISDKNANITCSICLETNTTLKTHCGHHFHLDCLAQWLKKTPNCPDCRNPDLHKFQILCCRCFRLSRALGNLDMGPSYTCKHCKTLPS